MAAKPSVTGLRRREIEDIVTAGTDQCDTIDVHPEPPTLGVTPPAVASSAEAFYALNYTNDQIGGGALNVNIRVTGFVQALTAIQAVGAAGKAVNGPLATFVSRKPYAGFIETGRSSRQVRRAGPARMFELGVKETAAAAPAILKPAIIKGAAAVGQAKRKIRDLGIENIRKRTPVLTGALRDSVSAGERPGIG
jgi:hypothetical protein